ncbi:diguanylate cyclase domain-containing protein [Pelosinus sp. sgz500959]|uniref:sensor domain-containing diguanylate cyclase/phosphohydrolase n=1 Tax=Pelosinus sp. sgz500959 TaxID=3242472 RepID=UPI0036726F5D
MVRRASSIAFKITMVYAVTSILWILLSDRVLHYFISDPVSVITIEIVKGWLFVGITAVLLYRLIFQHMKIIVESEQKLQEKHEETMLAYEELIAQEEELKQQFDEILNREEQVSRRNECLYALHEASLILVQEYKVQDPFAIVVSKMMALSGAQFGYIYLLDKNDMLMKSKVIDGFSVDEIKTSVKKGEGLIGQVWKNEETLVIDHYHKWEDRLTGHPYNLLRTAIGLPLKAGGEVIGVFSMNYTEHHVFDKEERLMLDSFAELASIALVNLLLHEELQTSQKRNQALIDALPDSIFQLDQHGTLLDYKKGKELEWAIDMQGRIGEKIETFLLPEYSSILMDNIEKTLLTGVTQVFEYQQIEQGVLKYQEIRILKSGINEVIAIAREITTRKELECKLQYYALHDKVTGLYNRSYFEEKIQQLSDSCQVPIGIIMCDIDGLKLVNDTFGHQAGDELLMSAVKIIESCLSAKDEIARVGGDEFAILLPNKDQIEVENVCHKIRECVSQFRKDNLKIPMSISLGIGLRSQPEQSLYEVFKIADDNMYREKLHSSQSIRSSIVQTLAKALEARDFVTSGHADRLQYLIVELAMAIGLSDSRLSDLRLFGRFHDIGKVGIPDEILFKPGRLTDSEFEIMKRHCEIGYRIAQSSGELAPIADWILKHQEWWNGQGYPLGIKGEAIPLACRILSIVDAYDAMTNERPYRDAICHDDAIAEIERCVGTQFDPNLVEIFKNIVAKTLDLGAERHQVIMREIAATNHQLIDTTKEC